MNIRSVSDTLIKTVFALLMIQGFWGRTVFAAPIFKKMELSLVAKPLSNQLLVSAKLFIEDIKPGVYSAVFTEPRKISRFIDQATGQTIPYKFSLIPGVAETTGYKMIEFTLESSNTSAVLILDYEYDKETMAGYVLNPSTNDNLHLGQVTTESIYSSHLYYYPEAFEGPQSARIEISVPKMWTGVSSGVLTSKSTQGDLTTFIYESSVSSGRLPYSLAIYPYQQTIFHYQDRLPIAIYHSPDDLKFAKEKQEVITTKILPFLETLMGPFPFEDLKIVEVFPWEGNTGLAARGIVMLSQKVWFSERIDEQLTNIPAKVLVDEMVHISVKAATYFGS